MVTDINKYREHRQLIDDIKEAAKILDDRDNTDQCRIDPLRFSSAEFMSDKDKSDT